MTVVLRSAGVRADNEGMEHGARSTRGLVALVAALVLLLGACGSSDTDVASDAEQRAGQGDADGRDARGSEDADDDGEVAAATTSTTSTTASTTTTSTTTTTVPPTTAAPTTQPAPPPTPAPPPPPPPPPSGVRNGTRNTGCEQYMYSQINAARANAGRSALTFDTGIQYIALDWSDEMSGSQTLRHNPNYGDQIVRHRDYRTAGENVGRGYEQGSLFQAFMNSPGHRANIESTAYSHVTVGCLTDGGGQLWVTQNFWGG